MGDTVTTVLSDVPSLQKKQGLLDALHDGSLVTSVWDQLVKCVRPDGMLGYVQPFGGSPVHIKPDDTEIYGPGAFLMAGSELYKITQRNNESAC